MRGGCTGHEIPMLLFFAIPGVAGIATDEAQWFIAAITMIPVVLTIAPSQYWLGEYNPLSQLSWLRCCRPRRARSVSYRD
jgi:hypothetical protein